MASPVFRSGVRGVRRNLAFRIDEQSFRRDHTQQDTEQAGDNVKKAQRRKRRSPRCARESKQLKLSKLERELVLALRANKQGEALRLLREIFCAPKISHEEPTLLLTGRI